MIEHRPVSLGRRDVELQEGPLDQYEDFEELPDWLDRTGSKDKLIDYEDAAE